MKLLKSIIYGILSLQETVLRHRLSKTIGAKNRSKSKRHYGNGFVLDLNTMAETEKQKLEEELTLILKRYDYNPEEILKYIENQGTKVYRVKDAAKILNPIGENEGFIYPEKHMKAIYILLSLGRPPALKTDEMFIISEGSINKYYFIYHFYNWYAYKHGIAGMDRESQDLLKKFLFTDTDTKTLQLSEIYQLKDAIREDKASIEFVVKLCRNYDGAKQALDKMKNEGSAKL